MSLLELLTLLVVAGVCGAIGQSLAGYSHGGCLVAIALGFIGALLGRWLSALMNLPDLFVLNMGGHSFPIVWSIIGAAVFVAFLSIFSRRRRP